MDQGAVQKKVQKMLTKAEETRRLFNLPESEAVIQDYTCSLWRSLHVRGRMFVTQNYICWTPLLTKTLEILPFRKISEIKQAKSWLVAQAILVVSNTNEQFHFSGFSHRDETLNLLQHLLDNPPTFLTLNENELEQSGTIKSASGPLSAAQPPDPTSAAIPNTPPSTRSSSNRLSLINRQTGVSTTSDDEDFGGWGASRPPSQPSQSNWQSQAQITNASVVDTDTSRRALQKAYEARNLGIETLNELSSQADQLDRIENKVENIHYNLDKGERLIRGMESLGGALKNGLSNDKSVRPQFYAQDHTVEIPKKRIQKITVDILRKHSNDALTKAQLTFDEDFFYVLNEKKQIEKGCKFAYDSVDRIVSRARPLHLDVRFVDKTPRFRLCSSHIQVIVNEFHLRVTGLKVIFEANPFDYGSLSIMPVATKGREGSTEGFYAARKGPSVTRLLSENVSEDVKKAVQQQERDLDEIANVVGELGAIAGATGGELDRQINQIDRVTNRTEQANERLHNNTNRVRTIH